MCSECDSTTLLHEAGLRQTRNRLLVLDALTQASGPLSAQEVIDALAGSHLNRVTIYRILDQLVAKGVINRLASPDRVDRYCLAEKEHHPPHAHFYCTSCGRMMCLDGPLLVPKHPESVKWGRVDTVQVLLDGVCRICLNELRD